MQASCSSPRGGGKVPDAKLSKIYEEWRAVSLFRRWERACSDFYIFGAIFIFMSYKNWCWYRVHTGEILNLPLVHLWLIFFAAFGIFFTCISLPRELFCHNAKDKREAFTFIFAKNTAEAQCQRYSILIPFFMKMGLKRRRIAWCLLIVSLTSVWFPCGFCNPFWSWLNSHDVYWF